MSSDDLVRFWKDPDAPGTATHPAGEISLDDLYGGVNDVRHTVTQYNSCLTATCMCLVEQ